MERVRLLIDVELDSLGDPARIIAAGWAAFVDGEMEATKALPNVDSGTITAAALMTWHDFYGSSARQLVFPF